MDTETRIAHQTIYHDEDHPSHILLPIVPTN
jgi:predicted acyl esterase